uniref:PAS domain-containing protein n=1 Tax=Panagrellus redivivus TaxID=6233 RepID=A0A7E4WB25_PANRE
MPQLPFPSPLPSIETYETQCLHNFFNENGNTSLFGLLIDKDGIIEYAIGSHIEDLLGLPIHHLLHRPFILLVSLQDRARICSLLPSSNSYRYGSTKRLQLDFICDKNSFDQTDLYSIRDELISNRNSTKSHALWYRADVLCSSCLHVMALTLQKAQNEIIDKLKKLSPADSDHWILRFDDGPKCKKDKKKTLVACVARRPSDDVPSGTFSLFLDRVNFRVVGFDGRNANIPFLTDTTFHGKTLQELCKRQEWPTIDLILETACHVQRSSTELTFSLVDGINLVTTVMTLSSKGSTGPIQLQCQIQRSFGTAGVTRSVSISDPAVPSTSNSIDLNANQMDKTAIPQLNRTISVPAQAHFFGPNSNSSTIGSCPDDRMDFVINSVVSNSESKPEGSMLRNLLNQAPSQYAPYTPTPTPKSSAGTVQNPPPSPFGYSSLLPVQIADMKIENSDMPETSEMPMPAKEPAKKKRVRNPAQKGPKMTKWVCVFYL